jgi:hypothetical protein
VPRRQADDLAQELLVDLPQDVGREDGEDVRAFGVIQAADDLLEQLIVDRQPGGEAIGRLSQVL